MFNNKFNRSLLALLTAAAFAFSAIACSTTWESEAEAIIEIAVPAVTGVFAIAAALEGTTVSAADVATIDSVASTVEADLNQIPSLISQYETAAASAQQDIAGQISAVLVTAENNLNSLLPQLHITDTATVAKISAVLTTITNEVEGIAALIPLVSGAANPSATALAKARLLSAGQFKKTYNAALLARSGNAYVDAAAARALLR